MIMMITLLMKLHVSINPDKTINPTACQKPIIGKLNITGINQFHNNINGNANNKLIAKTNIIPNIANMKPAIIVAILISFVNPFYSC